MWMYVRLSNERCSKETAVLNVFAITFPIFLLIGIGYAMVRCGLFSQAGIPFLGRFVIYFALPMLVFKALAQRSVAEIMNLNYLAAYGTASAGLLLLGFAFAYLRQKKGVSESALFGLGISFSNSGFVGYPILMQLLGPSATVALALTMIVENMLMLPLAIALADSGSNKGQKLYLSFAQSLKGLTRHPIIIAIVCGFAFALLQIHLPAPLAKAVDMAASASGAVALFVIGGALVGLKVKHMLRDIGLVVLGKLVLHPLAVLTMLLLLPPFDPLLQVAAVAAACSPMLSIYPILGQKYGLEGRCAASLLATTVSSFFTISAAIWLFNASGFLPRGVHAGLF